MGAFSSALRAASREAGYLGYCVLPAMLQVVQPNQKRLIGKKGRQPLRIGALF
jgi:hypothetical protein